MSNKTKEKINMNLDEDLLEQVRAGKSWMYRSWEPEKTVIVLGRGNKEEQEVYAHRCQEENIPILRRRGGGGTVVLYPGILVVSLVTHVKHQYQFKNYFRQINDMIIEALEIVGISGLNQQGHSDICIHEKKILGSSMYRSKEILFYTASLMVSNDLHIIDRYLKHPSKEPEYRRGRSHQDFLTTIIHEYPEITLGIVRNALDTLLPKRIPEVA
jgi:lipoate-protein ligase A